MSWCPHPIEVLILVLVEDGLGALYEGTGLLGAGKS